MLPLEERPAWLAALPPQYDLLREPLRRLLEVQAGIQTRPFLDAFTSGLEGLTPPATVIVGDLVGPYRLLQQLGDGGMGSVWLAERADGTLKRRVALKLPRMVWARDLAARMARERDILGSLEHLNIARLYDAGVDQLGRPFLALEYVEGRRIDQYCDENALTVAARVRLFLQVLDAVEYAHVNLVLHRDLKPGNVLVNQRGEVRLLDFGIAKLMGDDESSPPPDQNSRTLARAMTPRYASPEQVQHIRLTLASDVYSLGVMLYELLVGASPLITHKGSRAEIETAILEGYIKTPSRAKFDEPTATRRAATPSRLSRVLRGDLDAVLLKALSRNVVDRYPSVAAFRVDLTRWLDERPVLAKPPSRFSIIRKFIARNLIAVSIGSIATCAVLTATTIAILQAHEAQIESRRATATRDFLIGLFENANPELHGGREVSARELLAAGEESLSKTLQEEPETAAEIALSIGNAWARLGDYENQLKLASQRRRILLKSGRRGLYASALIAEAQIASHFGDVKTVGDIVNSLDRAGERDRLSTSEKSDFHWLSAWLSQASGDFDRAERSFATAENLARLTNDSTREVSALYGITSSQFSRGDWSGALSTYKRGLRLVEKSAMPDGERLRRSLELHGALFDAGAYEYGWPALNELFRKAEQTLGVLSGANADLAVLWMNWAIRVGELNTVSDFLDRASHSTERVRLLSSTKFESEWILAEARHAIASGNYEIAVQLVREKRSNTKYKNYWLAMDLVMTESFIRGGKASEALN